jgi:iron(III) transport system ATP-binding protein
MILYCGRQASGITRRLRCRERDPLIKIRGLTKDFDVAGGVISALPPLDLDIERNEFFVLLGPSGSGKSTLLRCVAGIEVPQAGEIQIGDKMVYSQPQRIFLKPEQRGLGMVFQSYAVWPHMTVYQNVALPLLHGANKVRRNRVDEKVRRALALVQIEQLADRPVPLLSGGQQQRVALARALAIEPAVLLMDEPLSNLDAKLREEVRAQIHEVTRAVGVTVLYVTHDQTEALSLADRVAMIDHGRILQIGEPEMLYQKPTNRIVADFFGQMNWLPAQTTDGGVFGTEIGSFSAPAAACRGRVSIGMRPSEVRVSLVPTGLANEFSGTVIEEQFLGDYRMIKIRPQANLIFHARVPIRDYGNLAGKDIWWRCESAALLVFPEA